MSQKTDKWLEENQLDLIEQCRAVIRFPSIEGPAIEAAPAKPAPAPGYPPIPPVPASPFGANVRACEDYVIKICNQYGIPARDNEGFYAVADAGVEEGVEKEMLGIVAHLDVVPEGTGWEQPPFSSNIVGDRIYGRGAIDDKGPAIAALFALRAVKETGYKFNRQVRIIFGLNEETGMKCIDKYVECERVPDISFTPDGSYPLANSEFGICHASFTKKYASKITFKSGDAPNIVPASAVATLNGKTFETKGVQTHASLPWEGENAAQKMFKLLATKELEGEDKKVVEVLDKYLGEGYFGEGVGLAFEDETGKQTLNVGIVDWNEEGFTIILDLRCPNAVKEETVKSSLTKVFDECGAELSGWSFSNGYYLSPDSEIVNKLMKVYQNRTGDMTSKPITMGGGTYARHLPNAVSFGPEGFMCDCSCHVPNEYITKDQLLFNAKMIADAIIALACEE